MFGMYNCLGECVLPVDHFGVKHLSTPKFKTERSPMLHNQSEQFRIHTVKYFDNLLLFYENFTFYFMDNFCSINDKTRIKQEPNRSS